MKRRNFSRILSFMLVALLGLQSVPMTVFADTEAKKAPEKANWTWGEEAELPVVSAPEGVVLSYQEGPVLDVSFADKDLSETNPVRGYLPASYSSSSYVPSSMTFEVKKDIVTPIKNQNPYGTCWSHAAMSVAETSYIMNYGLTSNAINFNEYQHVWYAYHEAKDALGLFGGDRNVNYTGYNDLDGGGNNLISLCMLASWTGASNADESVFDAQDVLSGNVPSDSFAYDDYAHLENGYILFMPDMYSSNYQTDMNIIKQAIMDYGSLAMSYFAGAGYPYESYDGVYQYINQEVTTNHSVTIVGWNDNIPASAFPLGAPGNGAWLVKNSWGTSWGADGYFWLSYYDGSIGSNAFAFDFASADNYDNNYQYDGGGNFIGYQDYWWGEAVAANAFVADSNETIEAVGFTIQNTELDYEIRIYTDLGANDLPQNGTLVHTQSGHVAYAGFHTIELTESIPVDQGERYAVVVIWSNDTDETIYLCADETDTWNWVDFYSYAKAGESYTGYSVDTLSDVNAGKSAGDLGYSIRIKSFTNEAKGAYDEIPWGVQKHTDGNWYLFRDGQIDWSYYGLAQNEYGIWYVAAGKVDFSVNCIAPCGDGWYYFQGGQLQKVTTLAQIADGSWWYVENGKLNFGYTGLACNAAGWFYVENGAVNWNHTGLTLHNGTWFYVENGAVNWGYTGLTLYNGTWFYVEGGILNWNYTGLTYYNDTWFYVEAGVLNWNYSGLCPNNGAWFYVEGGVLNWGYNGLAEYNGAWYCINNGVLNMCYTGLVAHNGGWFYVQSGVLNWSYTGLVEYGGAWYYVQDGVLNWGYTGVVYYCGAWYYVENGVMQYGTTI